MLASWACATPSWVLALCLAQSLSDGGRRDALLTPVWLCL